MSRLDELIKELCPNGVEYKKLGEIFNLKNGYTPSKANKEYWENTDINCFRIEDININGGILEDSIQKVNTKGIKGSLFSAKSLIVSTTATIRKHALILKDFICNQ
ncbi:MAG: restriction endonuclease subunit S [Fusobacterium polymorphum]